MPQPLLQDAGEPPVPLTTWIAGFNCWLTLVELERGEVVEDKTKNRLLFGLLGSEALRQLGDDPIVAQLHDHATTHAAFQEAVRRVFTTAAVMSGLFAYLERCGVPGFLVR